MSVIPVARNTDPSTSHVAAHRSREFAGTHSARILAAIRLMDADGNGCTAKEIADATGLTVVQIDRRLPELERDGHVQVAGDHNARDVVRDGYRVWELVDCYFETQGKQARKAAEEKAV